MNDWLRHTLLGAGWPHRPPDNPGTAIFHLPAARGELAPSGILANALPSGVLTCTFSYAVSLYGSYRYFM